MFKRNIENYPVYLLIGRTVFDFVTQSTNAAAAADNRLDFIFYNLS